MRFGASRELEGSDPGRREPVVQPAGRLPLSIKMTDRQLARLRQYCEEQERGGRPANELDWTRISITWGWASSLRLPSQTISNL